MGENFINRNEWIGVLVGAVLAALAPLFVPFPYFPVFVFVFSLSLLVVLGLSDFRKMLVTYLFLIPLVNINFVIDGPRAFKPLIGRGVHFDGMAMLLVVFLWSIAWARGRASLPNEPKFMVIWILYLTFSAISVFVHWTFRPFGQSWILVEQFLYFGVFLVLFSTASERGATKAMSTAIVLGSSLASLSGLVNFLLMGAGVQEIPMIYWSHVTTPSLGGTIHHRSFFSAYLLLALPLSIAITIGTDSGRRFLPKGGVIVQTLGLAIAKSKGGLAAMLAVGALVIWNSAYSKTRKGIWALALAIFVGGLLCWTVSSQVLGSFESSFSTRWYTLRMSLPLVRAGFWSGYGLDSFPDAFRANEKKQTGVKVPPFRFNINKQIQKTTSHNSYLTKFVEHGVGGFGAFMLLLGYVLVRMRPRKTLSPEAPLDLPSLLIFSGLVGFLLYAFLDDLFSYSKLVVTFWAVAAIGIAAVDRKKGGGED